MTKQELMSEDDFLKLEDIMKMYDCSTSKAYGIMRGIKSVSNRFKRRGMVHITDYEKWLDYMQDKDESEVARHVKR